MFNKNIVRFYLTHILTSPFKKENILIIYIIYVLSFEFPLIFFFGPLLVVTFSGLLDQTEGHKVCTTRMDEKARNNPYRPEYSDKNTRQKHFCHLTEDMVRYFHEA